MGVNFDYLYETAYGEQETFESKKSEVDLFCAMLMSDIVQKANSLSILKKNYEYDFFDIMYLVMKESNIGIDEVINALQESKKNINNPKFEFKLFFLFYKSNTYKDMYSLYIKDEKAAFKAMGFNKYNTLEYPTESEYQMDRKKFLFNYFCKPEVIAEIRERSIYDPRFESLAKYLLKAKAYLTSSKSLPEIYKGCSSFLSQEYSQEDLLKVCDEFFEESKTDFKKRALALYNKYFSEYSNSTKSGSKENLKKDSPSLDDVETNVKGIENLDKGIIGQRDSVNKIKERILSSLMGFNDDQRPVASFLLTGPTGVGKTETAKQVAKYYCGGKLFTLDMTTFKSRDDISRLVGASAGFVGYGDKNTFVDFLTVNPKCVLLFDEIDKCHEECLDVLMRMLDEGEFIDAKGNSYSLKDTIVFCTTNLTEYMEDNSDSLSARITSGNGIRKEIAARYDEILEYRKLSFDEYKEIAKIFISKRIKIFENNRQGDGIHLTYDNDLLEKIVRDSDYRTLGARAIKTSIQHNFVNRVSRFLMDNKDLKNCEIKVSRNNVEVVRRNKR